MTKKLPSSSTHEEKETLQVDVLLPGHDPRVTTSLFRKTKELLIKVASALGFIVQRPAARCWVCDKTAEEVGQPLEAHHFGIERAFIDGPIDWKRVQADFPNYDWENFDPRKPEMFVDNMEAQGILLCKAHHTGKGAGIHTLPFPLWVMQRYLPEGTKFSPDEVIHHDDV